MPKLAYIKVYFDDFEAATALLPDDRIDDLRWKYLRLLVKGSYEHGNKIPAVDRTIARLSGIERTKGWRKEVALLRGFFVEENGFLVQKRAGIELEKMAGNNVIQLGMGVRLPREGGERDTRVHHTQSQKGESVQARQIVGVGVEGGDNFGGGPRISDEVREEARKLHPELDIEDAEHRWRVWSREKGEPVLRPRKAFLAFCAIDQRKDRA